MKKQLAIIAIVILLVAGAFFVYRALATDTPQVNTSSLIGDNYEIPRIGFNTAEGDYDWQFPLDYGSHPKFQREEWNLSTQNDCAVDLKATFHLLNILPDGISANRPSEWAVERVLTATLNANQDGNIILNEVIDSRVALDLAGVDDNHVWVGNITLDWQAQTLTLTGLDQTLTSTLELDEPQIQTEPSWFVYQQDGRIAGDITSDSETVSFACTIVLEHRFGTP